MQDEFYFTIVLGILNTQQAMGNLIESKLSTLKIPPRAHLALNYSRLWHFLHYSWRGLVESSWLTSRLESAPLSRTIDDAES